MSTFCSHSLNFSCYLLRFQGYEMCTARLFSQGVDFFALIFYLDTVVPHQPFLADKTRDTGLPDGEDHTPLRSLILT